MNRIVIIGNGFDLAHGLKTSYKDFINWYWEKEFEQIEKCGLRCYEGEMYQIYAHDHYTVSEMVFDTITQYNEKHDEKIVEPIQKVALLNKIKLNRQGANNVNVLVFKNRLYENICKNVAVKKWVDIEYEYYLVLKQIADANLSIDEEETLVEALNKDLVTLKEMLAEYLRGLKQVQKKDEIFNCIVAPFRYREIAVSQKEKWNKFFDERIEMSDGDISKIINSFDLQRIGFLYKIDRQKYIGYRDFASPMYEDMNERILNTLFYPQKILLLNFNYTKTVEKYIPTANYFAQNTSVNYIHGSLDDSESIIFGYGDEVDQRYKELQERNINAYLQHVKSINYFNSPNYRRLLEFMESAPFQICIMGHSCGISDRTLLRTLFEHENCVSIKSYYYIDKENKNHYIETAQNISRNFIDPQITRDRVVNKEYCEPLPQCNDNK